jgi:hypothetical protein
MISHKALSIGILPGRVRCGEHLVDADVVDPTAEVVPVDAIAVANHVPGRSVLWEGFDDLQGGPQGAGMFCHVEVDDASALMDQNQEDEEHAEGCLLDLGRNLVLRRSAGAGLPAPEQTEAGTMPADDGVWLDNDEGIGPAGLDLGQANPESAVGRAEARPW